MAGDQTHPSSTVTRKPDDDIGSRGSAPANGNRQTAQQAEITGTETHGRDDADRTGEWSGGDSAEGRNPAPIGGSSQGHADQKAADDDRSGEKPAAGHYDVEQEGGSER